jgi:hypothetical protein
MTIEEAKRQKDETQKEILRILESLESNTGCEIDDITVFGFNDLDKAYGLKQRKIKIHIKF